MNTHEHKFIETESDDFGRQFGYCLFCLKDMQDLGNGMKTYQSHKRAKADLCERTAGAPQTELEKLLDDKIQRYGGDGYSEFGFKHQAL